MARLDPWPLAAFAGLLDVPAPPLRTGDPLPPLWQWFFFLDPTAQSALGQDGHPREGRFLPPFPDRRRMIAGGRLTGHRPLPIGADVVRRSSLASSTVKHGRTGEMAFVTVRHEFLVDGEALAVEEQDVVYRQQKPGRNRPMPAPTTDGRDAAAPSAPWSVTIDPDPALLFRFSALTYNAHRIHYDEAYTRTVEGYPGLVTHGPLLALLLLELPRRHAPDATVDSVDFRLTRPAFAGQRIVAQGTPDGPEIAASAGVPGADASISAAIRLR